MIPLAVIFGRTIRCSGVVLDLYVMEAVAPGAPGVALDIQVTRAARRVNPTAHTVINDIRRPGDHAGVQAVGITVITGHMDPIAAEDIGRPWRPNHGLKTRPRPAAARAGFGETSGLNSDPIGLGERVPHCVANFVVGANPIVGVIDPQPGPFQDIDDRIAVGIKISQGHLVTTIKIPADKSKIALEFTTIGIQLKIKDYGEKLSAPVHETKEFLLDLLFTHVKKKYLEAE